MVFLYCTLLQCNNNWFEVVYNSSFVCDNYEMHLLFVQYILDVIIGLNQICIKLILLNIYIL